MLNTHGLKIKGLRKIAGETKDLSGYYSDRYLQLNYNPDSGEAWTDYHVSYGQNNCTTYLGNVIVICNICEPLTMQQIADLIYQKLREREAI